MKAEKMAATAETSQSADSYIGSVISLISKSEIRYEGVLFHINPHESSIGLKNVRSFGTEGRKKDGPQVLPSDKVYDYIYFRGSDIKDLQVLSSSSVQSMPAIPDDPAIIQSHYQYPAVSSSLSHSSASSMTTFSSNSQLGPPSSTFQGSVPQYQPLGHMVSWGSQTPTAVNSNEYSMYWHGLTGPSGGYSYLQQPSLLAPPPGLLPSPGPQQMQHATIKASIPSDAPKFPEIPHPLLQPSNAGSLNSALLPSSSASSTNSILLPPSSASSQNSTVLPASGSLNSKFSSVSNLPMGHAAPSVSNEVSNGNAHNDTNAAPGFNFPLAASLTSGVNTNNIALQFGEKFKLPLGSTFPNISMSTSKPPIVGTSGSNHSEVPTSLVTPGQLLQSAPTSPPTILPSSLPLKTAHKDIEVVQTSTVETLPTDKIEAQAPILPTPSVSSGKMNEASLDSQHHDKGLEQGKRNGPHRAAVHTHRSTRGRVEERGNKSNGVTWWSHHDNNIHVRGRRNGLYGTASHSHPNNIRHTWGIEKMNDTAPRPYYGGRGRGRAQGRTNMLARSATKFTEDFDFEAMNEKFNKDEVWGELVKSIQCISEDNGDVGDSQDDDRQHEDADGLLKLDIKPVYVKDEFFDSLSSNTFDHEPKKERSKSSELKKLDAETFGGFQVNRGGRGERGVGRGGWSLGSGYGRGNGHAGRGQGRAVWSRVT